MFALVTGGLGCIPFKMIIEKGCHSALSSRRESVGIVLEDQAFQYRLGDLLLFRCESGQGFKLKPQVIIRPALILIKNQLIGSHAKGQRQTADSIQRGLGCTALIA